MAGGEEEEAHSLSRAFPTRIFREEGAYGLGFPFPQPVRRCGDHGDGAAASNFLPRRLSSGSDKKSEKEQRRKKKGWEEKERGAALGGRGDRARVWEGSGGGFMPGKSEGGGQVGAVVQRGW